MTAALVVQNGAQEDSESDKSIVVESRAYVVLLRSALNGSLTYSLRAMPIRGWAKSAQMRQSRVHKPTRFRSMTRKSPHRAAST